jgi:uncharacterized membrane protein YfcA
MSALLPFTIAVASKCFYDSQCERYEVCDSNACVHKPLFPLEWVEIVGCVIIFIASGLSNAGGIGGGPLIVTILITIFNFSPSDSVPMSQLVIFGGSLVAVSIKLFLRHPTKDRPLIDFDIGLLLTAPLLTGVSIGVIINLSIPQWLVLSSMTVLLAYLSIDTTKTAFKIYTKENSSKNFVKPLQEPNLIININQEKELTPDLEKIYNSEKKTLPPRTLIKILLVFSIVIVTTFIRGSKNFRSIIGIDFCSDLYWIVSFIILLGITGLAWYFCYMMIRNYNYKYKLGYGFDSKDLKWTAKKTALVCVTGLVSGIAAGVIGIGGGIIMNPVMLRLGIRPEVSTATSSFMVLFSSTISMLQYAIARKLNYVYGLWLLLFSCVGSFLGVFVVKRIVDKYRRSSVIVMVLALIMITCGIVVPTYGILLYLNENKEDGFNNYCY